MQAKDLKPGWWFSDSNDELRMFTYKSCNFIKYAFRRGVVYGNDSIHETAEVTHHPNCTGWDYVIPKRVRLEVGKRYVMRNGEITGLMERREGDLVYAFISLCDVHGGRGRFTWTADGVYCTQRNDDDYDIISEYVEPPAIDPGEGWRLLGDEEYIREGDEYFRCYWASCYGSIGAPVGSKRVTAAIKAFRRRIEPAHVPFTQASFRKHSKKMVYEKSQPSHWFRPQEVKPHAVLIGALWVEWDRLLTGFEFVGGGVCGEARE